MSVWVFSVETFPRKALLPLFSEPGTESSQRCQTPMRSPHSAHPTSTAPTPSLCSGSSLCTPSTHCSAGAASNMTASFTVSGLLWNALLFSIPSHHFILFIFSFSNGIPGFWSDDGFTKGQFSFLLCSYIVVCFTQGGQINQQHSCPRVSSSFGRIVLMSEMIQLDLPWW